MKENIKNLKTKFRNIQKMGMCKSLRNGTTGIGFTFETLIGKNEDRNPDPDFNGIEIKVKLGYTKSPTTLFCLNPNGHEYVAKYLLEKYGYPDKSDKSLKCLRVEAHSKKNKISANKYILKLKINYELKRIELIILDLNLNIIDSSIYWEFSDLETRLIKKLTYLAYVKGYPYKRNNDTYYKYTNMNIYKLKSFQHFLKLIEENKIHVIFNIGIAKKGPNIGKIEDRGTAFKINNDCIDELFELID